MSEFLLYFFPNRCIMYKKSFKPIEGPLLTVEMLLWAPFESLTLIPHFTLKNFLSLRHFAQFTTTSPIRPRYTHISYLLSLSEISRMLNFSVTLLSLQHKKKKILAFALCCSFPYPQSSRAHDASHGPSSPLSFASSSSSSASFTSLPLLLPSILNSSALQPLLPQALLRLRFSASYGLSSYGLKSTFTRRSRRWSLARGAWERQRLA